MEDFNSKYTGEEVEELLNQIANKEHTTVGFANDLTGVLEATAEEFTFRPSAGDKSIRDESAVIRKIKGNTIVARYADNTSKVLPMNIIGIETIGFNAYNGEYAEVIGGQAYYLGGAISTAYFATVKGGDRVEITADSDGIYTPPANGYIYATGNDICINLSHSGVRNGEYEPYVKHVRLLPEIRKYFPNGMNGNANVWDEINTEKAIKRWGVVDLGTLTWSVQSASANIFWSNSVSSLKKAPYSSYPNAISIFDTGRFYDLQVAKSNGVTTEIIGVHDSQSRIMLYNPNYEATTEGAAQLKASLDGVLLYYELAEPEYTDITEPMQLDYEVEDFGTEKALSLASSAPFRVDIVYQFNAEGRIRDNSRNIERIENTITNRLIPSQTAMLGLPNKVMTWDGNKTMMSLPIAESIAEWEMEESPLGVLPTGQQVIEYISLIKGSLSSKLMPKETIGLSPNGIYPIGCNTVYEMATAANITYNIGLRLVTDIGVDVIDDNEWRIRIDTRNGFSGSINFELSDGYLLRWAYPDDISSPSTPPSITQGHIYDIQFRMIGKTLLGSYKKY